MAWVASNANGDWEHSYGFNLKLRGDGEFFASLDLGDTLLHGLLLHNERISPRCRAWCERNVLFARGHIEEYREANAWFWTTLTSEMEDAIKCGAEFLAGAGREVDLRIVGNIEPSEAVLFELLSSFAQDCGVITLDQMVEITMDDDLTCTLSCAQSPNRLRPLSDRNADGWTIRFAPQMAGELLGKFKQAVT